MNLPHFPFLRLLACAALLGVSAAPTHALLDAKNLTGAYGTANLVRSNLTVQVGAQWLDIEEEAEVEVTTSQTGVKGPWLLEGTFVVPKGTSIVGCMLWNDDTLLMGKLRGKASAEAIFDSLVPVRDPRWARDPLLVEQTSETVYTLKLFPFETSGTRRFRLRYLVPLVPGQSEMSIRPLATGFLRGTKPAQFHLRLRGKATGVKIVRAGLVWPVELPSFHSIDLDDTTDVRLRWPDGPSGDGTCAIKARIDSGAWKGEFALFTGKVPDSILQKTALRSETVVLWRWISPEQFFDACPDNAGGFTARCLNDHGLLAVGQARAIAEIAQRAVENAGKIGLVADEGMEDPPRVYPVSDSTTTGYRNLRLWLSSISEDYLAWRIPKPSTSVGSGGTPLEISKNRDRFRTDLVQAGALYSADSGILRHLLVVTVGPVPVTGEFLQAPDLSSLPAGVSVASSVLVADGSMDLVDNVLVAVDPVAAPWPGVDLEGVVQARDGGSNVVRWNGVPLARARETLAGRLSMRAGSYDVSRDIVVRANGRGGFNTSLNVHGSTLGSDVTWSLYDEEGDTIALWKESPKWLRVDGDSVMPRLWGKSEAPLSPIFENRQFGPLFGMVDRLYSLLATPSDTMGRIRQEAYRDSGVPFLSYREIFPRQGYKHDGGSTGARRWAERASLEVRWLRAEGLLRIGLQGLREPVVEIRDLRGRLVASFASSQLAGRTSFDWRPPSGLGGGMLFVTVRSTSGVRTAKVLLD